MPYLPHTEAERQAMLRAIGVERVEDLFASVPRDLRLQHLDVPSGLSEPEAVRLLTGIAAQNTNVEAGSSFLGGGAYYGYVPAAVGAITGRAEFYTSYTPYQAEVSQGTLQVIYEYQTMIAELTRLDLSNASLYDGATALAEAGAMAIAATGRDRVAVLDSVDPQYRAVLRTYAEGAGYGVDEIEALPPVDIEHVRGAVSQAHGAVVAQSPDFMGSVLRMRELAEVAHASGSLFIAVVDPVSLGLLAPPGEYGADIAVGEGQNLGNWLSYGGPYLGFMATTTALQRRMPGRIVGASVDDRGQRAYVLTLQTREQHIRRERATSNICTNEALVALAATVYLALMGKQGIQEVANLALQKAHYAASQIARLPGFDLTFDAPFFREFVVSTPVPATQVNRHLQEAGIIGGLDLSVLYPGVSRLDNALLLACTEMTTRSEIDALVLALSEVAGMATLRGAATAVGARQ